MPFGLEVKGVGQSGGEGRVELARRLWYKWVHMNLCEGTMVNLNFWPEYRSALTALAQFSAQLRAEMKLWDGPLWLPHDFTPSAEAMRRGSVRDAIAEEVTRMYYRDDEGNADDRKREFDDIPMSGLWLVDSAQCARLQRLVELKDALKVAAAGLREHNKDRGKLNFTSEIQRDPSLVEALRLAGLSRLNLRVCYRAPRIIATKLKTIRWNYGPHKHVTPHLMGKLRAALENDSSPAAQLVLIELADLSDNEYVAEVYDGLRLTANVRYETGDTATLPCSGVIFYVSDKYPDNIGWNKAAKPERSRVRTSRIAPESILLESKLHRYLVQPEPKADE
ncbi:MAG: hypothetical protein EOO52_13710 [Gammaproteobacteria bacterium]|nr:MAG: hypothetical protein EOO52_13710 [Gammaproteobacteria bacterium]